jgi:thiamine kinase-like enzyme
MWTNNVLFKKNQDETLSDELCALIDWQTAFQGNPLFDLSFLLASSTNVDVRRKMSTEVVDIYFDTLSQIYKQKERELQMSRDQAHELFKLCQIQQAPVLGALMCLFGHKMEMSCPDKDFLSAKMSIICERTKQVMQDAVEYAKELRI